MSLAAHAQSQQAAFKRGDIVENDLASGGCPTYEAMISVLVAMAQTGHARDVMVHNDCLPFPPKMKLQVEDLLGNNIMKASTPDFPGLPPMFVSESGFHRSSSSPSPAGGAPQHPAWFSEPDVVKALDSLSSYRDVPQASNCAVPRCKVEQLICGNRLLKLAELLNTRADVYATENATKRELNHSRFKGRLPNSCITETCVFDSFRASTSDFLGGESPYPSK